VLLGRNAPVNLWDEEGNTPLHRAAQESNLAATALLCAGGAELQARNEAGRTALDEARASLTRFEGRGDPPHRQKVVAFLEAGGPCASLAARRVASEPSADSRREAMLSAGCDAGTARDCTNLALLYEQRGAAGDAVRAIALYDVGCQGGSARGCAYLGRAFERGRGVTADPWRALQLYRQACAAKDAWGCGYLGQAYATGRGVAKDPARAAALLKDACDGGATWSCR
jgi:TPR repeat protein